MIAVVAVLGEEQFLVQLGRVVLQQLTADPSSQQRAFHLSRLRLILRYSINIELPATRDKHVYDAIFKSIRENLM